MFNSYVTVYQSGYTHNNTRRNVSGLGETTTSWFITSNGGSTNKTIPQGNWSHRY